MAELAFTFEDPPEPVLRRGPAIDYEGLALVVKRARGRWVKLTEPRWPSFGATLRKHLGAEYEVTVRAFKDPDGGRQLAHLYVRYLVDEED